MLYNRFGDVDVYEKENSYNAFIIMYFINRMW